MYFRNLAEFRDTVILYTSFDTPLFGKSFLQFYTVIKFLTRFLYCKKIYKILCIIWNLIKMQLFNLWSGFFRSGKHLIHFLHESSAAPQLRYLPMFVLLRQILLDVQAVSNKEGFYQDVFLCFPCKTWIISWCSSRLWKHRRFKKWSI